MTAQPGFFELVGFGPQGWGLILLGGALMTVAISCSGFVIGAICGVLAAWAKVSGGAILQVIADVYTTVLRGVPDLLVIYLFYFGGSMGLTAIGRWFGAEGFIGLPGFVAGALAVGLVSGAQQAEVFRGALNAVSKGEIEAAVAVGMSRWLRLRRIVGPLVLRHALPGLGNVWQILLKESALISVTGVAELLRQAQVASGSTRQPFYFYLAAGALYLVITSISTFGFHRAEFHFSRGTRRS